MFFYDDIGIKIEIEIEIVRMIRFFQIHQYMVQILIRDVSISNGNIRYPIGTSIFVVNLTCYSSVLPLLILKLEVLSVISLKIFVPHAGEI